MCTFTLILTGGNVIGCAPIVIAESLEALQYPDLNFQIGQSSPHENSTLTMSRDVTTSSIYSILDTAWMPNTFCPINSGIYNPLSTTSIGNNIAFR